MLLSSFLIGIATGLMAGIFGVGGGIVATPLLSLLMKLSAQQAIGTTVAIILPTSLAAAYNYYKLGLIDLQMVKKFAVPSCLTSMLGAYLTTLVGGSQLMIYFAGLITLAALDMLTGFSQKMKERGAHLSTEAAPDYQTPPFAKILPVALLAGFLSGFFGVGGGFIMVPLFIGLFNMPVKKALGTSLLVIAAVSVPGTITHLILQHVRLDLVLMLVAGAVPASILGSKLGIMMKDNILRRAFGSVMLVVALSVIYKEVVK